MYKPPLHCFLPYSDATCGALLQPHIQDGSTVICMRSADDPRKGYILTAVNEASADMTDTLNGRVFYNTNSMTTRNTTVFDTIINQIKGFAGAMFRNNANSTDKDVLPGDVDIVNHGGSASLHVGKYLVQLKGSPMAFIDVASIQDQIRMVASKIVRNTVTTYQQVSDEVSVDDTAISATEAFGMAEGSDIESNWEDVEKFAVPFFRMQEIKGPAIDGKEDIILVFPQDTDMHTDTTEPPVVFKARTAVSGERTVASAKSISFIKTPNIKAAQQFGYNYTNARDDDDKKLDLLTPFHKDIEEPEEEEKAPSLNQEIMDAAINKMVDKLLASDYIPNLLQRMMDSGIAVSEKTLGMQFSEHTETGPSLAQAYNPPKFLQLTDPVTGKVHTYFDSTSFLSQEEDGSILICDGYGSEIRMSQGNIYISPALDLQLRPGRDMWGLVPRHMALDSQGYAVINSNKAVYLRSTGDMQLAAAAKKDGHGKLTLECNDKSNSPSSGIIIRSLGNAAFTSHDMYIGINSGTSETEGRVEDQLQGTLIIDAGDRGAIVSHCSRYMVDAEMFTAVAGTSAISIASNAIGLYAETVLAPVAMTMSPVNGTQKVFLIRNGELSSVSLVTSSTPGLQIKGPLVIDDDNIAVNGSILCMQTVVCRNSYYVNDGQIREDSQVFKNDITVKNIELRKDLESSSGAVFVINVTETIYQDVYIAGNCFRFPENYGVADTIMVPGMVWQEATRKASGNADELLWKELPVEDPDGKTITACYPGWTVWESATITQTGYETKPLNENYITNTKQENTNA
jgi:hypothetical protein